MATSQLNSPGVSVPFWHRYRASYPLKMLSPIERQPRWPLL